MLLFLSIVFWVSLLLIAPLAVVLLLRACVGKLMMTGYYCKHCHYDRRGIDYQADCPECGCPQSGRDARSNVARSRRARSPRRIAVMATLAVLVGGMVFGSRWLHRECEVLPLTVSFAARKGEHAKVKFLVNWFPELADGSFRFTPLTVHPPLYTAASENDLKMIDILLKAGADPDGDPLYTRNIPLREALLIQNNVEMARHLLEAGADPDIRLNTFGSVNLLTASCNRGRADFIALLLEFGADPDHDTIEGTGLCIACHFRDGTDITKLLLDAGADPNANPGFDSPLHLAARTSNLKMVQLLLDHGVDVNSRNNLTGVDETPLDAIHNERNSIHHIDTQAIIDLLRAHGGLARQELAAQQAQQRPAQRAAERAAEHREPDAGP